MSWRKEKEYDGLARYMPSYILRYDGVELAHAQQASRGVDLWFWYGDTVNTAMNPKPLAEVKAEAIAFFKKKQKA